MHAGVACQPFERAGEVDEVPDFILRLVQLVELRLLRERVLESDPELEGDELRDPVHVAVAHAEHAADVAHDGLRGHGAVGDDLRDSLPPVFVGDVLDDPVAAVHAEIDVEVGHRDALGIQEALEQQVVLERVEVRDAETVGDQRARTGPAAGSNRHAVGARPVDEIRDDQEIAGKSHLADDIELGAQALVIALGRGRAGLLRQPLRQPAPRLLAQEVLRADTARQRIFWQAHLAELQDQTAAPSDLDRVGERLRHVRKQGGHLLRRAQVLLMAVTAHAARIRQQRAVVYAHTRLVRFEVLGLEEAHIVGRDHGHAAPRGERHGGGYVAFLIRPPEPLQLDVEAVRKQCEPLIQCALRVLLARVHERPPDIAFHRAGERDQTLEVSRRQPAAVDHRDAALLPLEVRAAHEPRDVAVAGL